VRQVRNYLALVVAGCVGVRVASWLVAPFVAPLAVALVIAVAAEYFVGRRLS